MPTKLYKFIESYDDTARLINEKANQLYQALTVFDVNTADIDDFGKYYFTHHHAGRRLFFSIESSADIIYKSHKLTNKKLNETSFMDYGAGLGTLFLLAGMVGFKKVYFNDYFPQWAGYAGIIAGKLGITIDDYVSGDIDAVIEYAKSNQISIDIIASRNVVEHIYNLRRFYEKLYQSGITNICYATTTANYHNIAMRLKHYWYHQKTEKSTFIKQRQELIQELEPDINSADLKNLVKLTRGRAFNDFTDAVTSYRNKKPVPNVEFLSTNTCDCRTGVWAENMLTKRNYFNIIRKTGFAATYSAGFWDTHYKYKIVNLFTALLNRIIKISGSKGIWFAPFVNIIALKKTND